MPLIAARISSSSFLGADMFFAHGFQNLAEQIELAIDITRLAVGGLHGRHQKEQCQRAQMRLDSKDGYSPQTEKLDQSVGPFLRTSM